MPRQESGRRDTATTTADDRRAPARGTGGPGPSGSGASLAGPSFAGPNAQRLLALQRSAGNAAVTRVMLQRSTLPAIPEEPETSAAPRRRTNRPPNTALPAIAEDAETPRSLFSRPPTGTAVRRAPGQDTPAVGPAAPQVLLLPPYLRRLESPGLASVSGLDGYEALLGDLLKAVKGSEETVAGIRKELTGRPESFFGRGRSFAVRGQGRNAWYDVTLALTADPAETLPRFVRPPDTPRTGPAPAAAPAPAAGQARELSDPDDAATKLDVHHNSTGSASRGTARSSRYGGSVSGIGLAPTPVPGLTAGAMVNVGAYPFHSADESRTQRTVTEHRVLRSDEGTVQVPRRVRFTLRIEHSTDHAVRSFEHPGSLILRVPREHLVPATASALGPMTALDRPQARPVELADSLAAVAVTDSGDPQAGGRGLFDAVRSVLHPALTGPGAPGRGRLYAATSAATVTEDLPRLLSGWVTGEDLVAKDGSTEGSYRMRATLSGLAPGWATGRTQLRTHHQSQHSEAQSHGQGRGGQLAAGPAVGVGVLDAGPRARGGVMPAVEARKMRFASADQSTGVRQGAEIRGDKVLYRGRVLIAVEGSGPPSPAVKAGRGRRSAHHAMDVWVTLRADEARHLGLPLPPGTAEKDLFSKERDEHGAEIDRHLPFGAMGGSVSLSGLDTEPLISGIEQLFATHPKLAGYLPAHGDAPAPAERPRTKGKLQKKPPERKSSREEQTAQRENHRQLLTVLSETNLRANKEQLLSAGVPVRLRRKSTWTSHDVQVRVTGAMGELTYLGDTGDWLTRSTAGVTTGLQSGRSSGRGRGVRAVGQIRVVPGTLSGQVTGDAMWQGTRRDQGGPATRTDSLSNGDTTSSSFSGPLRLSVQVTLVARERTGKRALTPGAPGRDTPEVEQIASSDDAAENNPLRLGEQDVRLTTPTAFTLNDENHQLLEARATRRRATPVVPVAASGIGELTSGSWQPRGRTVQDWQFVETAGTGEPVRAMAYELLAKAAARNHAVRRDRAFETEGLAPRLAIEERLAPRAVSAALRQGVTSGWVVKNLRYPRRLAELSGAVGTRFALTRPRVVHRDSGAGTENYVLGGHQASGQRGKGRSGGFRAQVLGMQDNQVLNPSDDPKWRIGEAAGGSWTLASGSSASESLAGSIERNAHSPRGRDLYLVQCDLAMRMSAEVTVGGKPYVASAERTAPAEVSVWLTKEQCEAAGIPLETPAERAAERRAARERGEADRAAGRPAGSLLPEPEGGTRPGTGSGPVPAAAPVTPAAAGLPAQLRQDAPLGFGMIERLPDFKPLIRQLRTEGSATAQALVRELLPERQSDDPYDNVQRLLRVLDRDGATGLLAGAMDGGVTVELFRGRRTPYWAVFSVEPTGPGTVGDRASDGRDMEYITSAVTGRSGNEEKSDVRGVDAVITGAGKPELGQHPVKSTGAAAGLGTAWNSTRKSSSSARGQIGVKTVAEAKAESRSVTVPVRASLTLRSAEGQITRVGLEGDLVHRILEHDLRALDRATPVRDTALAGKSLRRTGGDDPAKLARWRSLGVALPDEAQVNGFRGAPGIRVAIGDAVRAAHGSSRFQDTGQAAAYAQQEAVSTEWLASALPLLASAGVTLPPAHATGVAGQDLETSLHAQLTHGRVLDAGDAMTFEAIAPSSPDGDRPAGQDHQQASEHGKNVLGAAGAGLLNAQEFRLNEALLRSGNGGAVTGNAAVGSGSMPVHKPKTQSVLVQFDLRVRVVARVRNRATRRVESAVRDYLLPTPVIVRMPAPAVRRMLASDRDGARVADPDGRLGAADDDA